MRKRLQSTPHAVAARVDQATGKLHLALNNGVELSVPCALLQGLEDASSTDLDELELSPTGLGVHFPRVDADIYIPGILQGVFGSRSWMAQQLGHKGGSTISAAKSAAARANGKLGGRPRRAPPPVSTAK
jgi:hypothetical protein